MSKVGDIFQIVAKGGELDIAALMAFPQEVIAHEKELNQNDVTGSNAASPTATPHGPGEAKDTSLASLPS